MKRSEPKAFGQSRGIEADQSRRRGQFATGAWSRMCHWLAVRTMMAGFGLLAAADPVPGQDVPNLFRHMDADAADLADEERELVERLRSQSTTKDVQLIRLAPGVIEQPKWKLNLSPGTVLNCTRAGDPLQVNDNALLWRGFWIEMDVVERKPKKHFAEFLFEAQTGYGSFTSGGSIFELRPLGDGIHVLIERDPTKVKADEPPSFKRIEDGAQQAPRVPPDAMADPPADGYQLDIIVLYTPAVARDHRDGSLERFVKRLEDLTNTSFSRAKVPVNIRVVHIAQVEYVESEFIDEDCHSLRRPTDGKIDDIHTLRDAHAADLVVMLVRSKDVYNGYASAIGATPETAFAVVKEEAALSFKSFPHEIGHLLGARHDPDSDSTAGSAHGFADSSGDWQTLMSTKSQRTVDRLWVWSTPDIKHPDEQSGSPVGTQCMHNNAMEILLTAARAARFRNPP